MGIIGLDYSAMYAVAKSLDINIDSVTLRKIRCLENHLLKEESKRDTPQSKFCQACRAAKKDKDCSTCDTRSIKLVEKGKS